MNANSLRVVLVDDEKPARERLARMLATFPNIEIVGEAGDGVSALKLISEVTPDIAFLDIEMPELDGLGVARSLADDSTTVVFVTAYDEYALKAFDAGAMDYLMKPVSETRLRSTIEKLLKRKPGPLADFLKQYGAAQEAKFAVRSGSKYVVCDPKDISVIQSQDHYSCILMNGKELLSDDSLETFEKRLSGDRFLRVHRSAIINLDYLESLEREGDRKYLAVLSDSKQTKVPISRERLDEVKSKLQLK